MRSLRYLPTYTVDDYRLWEGQWELIDGIPYAMSPSPARKHQWMAMVISSSILVSFQNNRQDCGECIVVQDLDWVIAENTVLRPDIAVICGEEGDFITSPPVLIVELLSPSTAHKDRQIKFEIYQEQGVKYYIIADPATKAFQVYQLAGAAYQEVSLRTFAVHDGCTIDIDLAKVMTEV